MPATKAKKAKAKSKPKQKSKPKPPTSETELITCPECGCDSWAPAVKMYLTRSFVGNKVSVEWPSRTGVDNHCVIICAQCAEVINVTPKGQIVAVGRKGLGDAYIRKTKGK